MKKGIIIVLVLISVIFVGCKIGSDEDINKGMNVPAIKQAELTTRENTLLSAVGSFKEVRVFSLENLDDYEWIETYIDIYDSEGFRQMTSTGAKINKDKTERFLTFSITEINENNESSWNVAFIQDESFSKYNMPIETPFSKSTTLSVANEKEYVEGEKNIYAYMIATDNNEILAPTVDSLEDYRELDVDEETVNYIFSYQLFEEIRREE